MSYATPDQLAEALNISVTTGNQQVLQDCLDAAADEIDRVMVDAPYDASGNPTWPPADPTTAPPLVKRTNVNRAVEWYKAPAVYNGGVGTAETGVLTPPSSGFRRHAEVLYTLTNTGASGVA